MADAQTPAVEARKTRKRRPRFRTSSWSPPVVADPLDRPRSSISALWGRRLLVVSGALGLHGLGLAGFALATHLFPEGEHFQPRDTETLVLQVVEPLPPAPPEEDAEPTAAPAPKRLRPRVEPSPPQPTPKPSQRAEPPPDPIDAAPEEPQASPPEPPAQPETRRRIVGLSFESTVTSNGNGPRFAVGSTRMGSTAPVAEKPETAPARSANQTALRPVSGGRTFTKPERVEPVEPDYPELLRARGIEADVVVLIQISPTGSVTSARVVRGAQDPAFNDAALAAARAQRFRPATRDGEAQSYSLRYTYRFRLDQI